MRVAAQVMLTAIERRRLETWASARSTTVRLVERSKIVLMACAGMPPHHSRQLRHAQARRSAAVDRTRKAHLSAFHSHEFILRSCGPNQPSRLSKRLVVLAKRSATTALNHLSSPLGGVEHLIAERPPCRSSLAATQDTPQCSGSRISACPRKGWSCSPNARPPQRLII